MIDLIIKVGQKFHLRDIDLDKLEKAATIEFESKNLSTYENTFNGMAAEHYMIEHYDYKNDPGDYKDVLTPCKKEVEIKSRIKEEYIYEEIEKLTDRKKWGTVADHVIAFLRKGEEYTCHSIWRWNDETNRYYRDLI